MTSNSQAKPATLDSAKAKGQNRLLESVGVGIIGFFLGSILWLTIWGFISLLALILTLMPRGYDDFGAIFVDYAPRALWLLPVLALIGFVLSRPMSSADLSRRLRGALVGVVVWLLLGVLFAILTLLSRDFTDSLHNVLDQSGILIPVLVAAALFNWKRTLTGRPGLWMQTFDSLFRNRSAIAGVIIVGSLALVANFAAAIAPYHPETDLLLGRPRTDPCITLFGCEDEQYIMGLDLNGRDLFSRVVWGARTSIPIGITAVTISLFFGTFLGLVAGYFGGWLDNVIMRILDVLLAFPALLLAIAIVTILGPGLENALVAIAIVTIPTYARLTRASVLTLKEQEFVVAEHALGAKPMRVMVRQILPNAMTPLIVQGTLGIGTAVLDAAALSFLGLGAQPPTAEWGQMLSESINYVFVAPHMVFFPGFAIMLTVLGFNLLGDGMRDALDPRLNKN